jgi:hypothetical protein
MKDRFGRLPTAKTSSGSAVVPLRSQIWKAYQVARELVSKSNYLRGTAGWTRTTDLLIHSPCQAIDFVGYCWKSLSSR